jgi:PGF-pre-PGF domain-containing protein
VQNNFHSTPDLLNLLKIWVKRPEVKKIFQKIRLLCLCIAILMLLSVSVHPAMAEMDIKDKVDRADAAVAEARERITCPGCAGGMSPERAAQYLNKTNMSVNIREIKLDTGYSGPTVANARSVHLPMGTLQVHTAGGISAQASAPSERALEIIADYDNDTAVSEYIRNVTLVMGYTERTNAEVSHYSADMKGVNITDHSRSVIEVVTYSYTNQSTKYRFKFIASQSIETGGKAIPPKMILPGQEFPPLVQDKDDDAECWYWYLLIGIAVLAVIAAIVATIAAATIGGAAAYRQYRSVLGQTNNLAVPPPQLVANPVQVVAETREVWVEEIHTWQDYPKNVMPAMDAEFDAWIKNEQKRTYPILVKKTVQVRPPLMGQSSPVNAMSAESAGISEAPEPIGYESDSTGSGWMIAWFLVILIFLILVGIAFPLVGAALTFLITMVIGLMVCKGLVNEGNDRARLEELLNPETLVGITERNNNQTVFIAPDRSSWIMVVLPEKSERGERYSWNVTASPATSVLPMVMTDPGSPDASVRVWTFFTPVNKIQTFTVRYVPSNDPVDSNVKQFSVKLVPLIWEQPEDVDTSSMWAGYGTSLAIDKRTDRMHISYLDYSGTWGGAGKLVYRSGIGTHWDLPLVVDDTISWATAEGKELARYTTIALDPDGNPQISYMDWRNGHLKFARKIAANDTELQSRPGVNVHDGWQVETVDDTSSYSGWGSSLAVDKEGTPHISYLRQDGFSDLPQLKYAHWNKTAWNIQTLGTVAGQRDGGDQRWWIENVKDGALTSIALDSNGHPHIAYVDYNHAPKKEKTCYTLPKSHGQPDQSCKFNLQMMYTSWNGTGWNADPVDNVIYPKDQPGLIPVIYTWHGLYSSLAIDEADRPHISYFSSWNRLCANGAIPIPGSVFCDGQWLGKLKYASNDGTGWKTGVVDETTNSVGMYSSLKIDKNYHPHISYVDSKNGFLRYATNSGSRWFRSIPDRQNSDTGRFSSLALDKEGSPRIVYMDYKNGHVKYVYGNFNEQPTIPVTTITEQLQVPLTTVPPEPAPSPILPASQTTSGSADREETISLLPFPAGEAVIPPVNPAEESDGASQDQSVSTASNAPGTPAGTKITYVFDAPSPADPVSVRSVSFIPGQTVPESRCTIRQESPLADFRIHGPARYQNIGISWINPSAITGAAISFGVTKAWLTENQIEPGDVVLMRQHDYAWAGLPTSFDRQEGDRYYYTATTPGFSYFAVTDKKTAEAESSRNAVTEVTAAVSHPVSATAADPATTPDRVREDRAAKPVVTATDTLAPASPGTLPEAGFPVLWITIAALVSMLGIAGFFIGRRMWWARQNPALFRKYE